MIQYISSLTLLLSLCVFIIQVIISNKCKTENRFENMEVFIEGLIKDGDHTVTYNSCGHKTSYEKKGSTHKFKLKKSGLLSFEIEKQNMFLLKRGMPRSRGLK